MKKQSKKSNTHCYSVLHDVLNDNSVLETDENFIRLAESLRDTSPEAVTKRKSKVYRLAG